MCTFGREVFIVQLWKAEVPNIFSNFLKYIVLVSVSVAITYIFIMLELIQQTYYINADVFTGEIGLGCIKNY